MAKEYINKHVIDKLSDLENPQNSILLLGSPVEHSFSPLIHNGAFEKYNLNYIYKALEVDEDNLESVVHGIRDFGIKGCNVTIPHKVKIMEYLDEISEEARLIGAVNTVLNTNGKLYGYNTDAEGFYLSLLEKGIKVKNKKIAILGAGGAAKSICVKLTIEGADKIDIYNRNQYKSEKIVRLIKNIRNITTECHDLNKIKKEITKQYDIVINCTPVGMHPKIHETIIEPEKYLRSDAIAVDIIYNPLETKFLEKSRENGMKTLNGLGMLIYQAIEAFEIWTDVRIEKEFVENTLYKAGI
ncbi:MAG: hypothetical protein PWQ37_1202 [Candidatus Petromonas sp.]|jgi:shikimate dehydrogenase|nr:hypothetical protein [Candidatus Petromonas sp.]